MLKLRWMLSALLIVSQYLLCQSLPPKAPKRPIVDQYYGLTVTDDYRWLENWSNPETQAWSNTENSYARNYLDRIKGRGRLRTQIKEIVSKPSARFYNLRFKGGTLFAIRQQPPREQPFLVTLKSPDDISSARVIVDPVELDPSGQTAIDFYVPSHNGRYVAVSMSRGGSETGDVSVYETSTGKALSDSIPRVNGGTAGGSVAWNADNSGFYYTRYPTSGERADADLNFYQPIWFHRLGADHSTDTYSLGKDFPRIAEIVLKSSDDGHYTLATMANGDGGEFSHYLRSGAGEWIQLSKLSDHIDSAYFGADGNLYLLSREHAPKGKVLKLPLSEANLASAKTIIAESDVSIESITSAGGKLYIPAVDGGPSVVRIYDVDGRPRGNIPIEPTSAVYQILGAGQHGLLFEGASYVKPTAWYRFDSRTNQVSSTSLQSTAAVDLSDIQVSREFATSKDGTKIPLAILRKRGTPSDGKNPTLLTGTAAITSVCRPGSTDPAVANLRGGGEYGEAWHLAGNLTRKQNVFDDFEACARYLITAHYT